MTNKSVLVDRFMRKVNKTKSHWIWTAAKIKGRGDLVYGNMALFGETLAHRISYRLFNGPIPRGLTVDHQCNIGLCVNPKHLKVMTLRENILRGSGPSAKNARKTVCSKGHPYKGENVFSYKNSRTRRCAICERFWHKKLSDKRTAERRRLKSLNPHPFGTEPQ